MLDTEKGGVESVWNMNVLFVQWENFTFRGLKRGIMYSYPRREDPNLFYRGKSIHFYHFKRQGGKRFSFGWTLCEKIPRGSIYTHIWHTMDKVNFLYLHTHVIYIMDEGHINVHKDILVDKGPSWFGQSLFLPWSYCWQASQNQALPYPQTFEQEEKNPCLWGLWQVYLARPPH